MTDQNIDYYNKNADEYFEKSVVADMSGLRSVFLTYLPECARILDAGCGSGRDSKAFLSAGYDVVSFDASKEMCLRASVYIGQKVLNAQFDEISFDKEFDGVWACASLNHVPIDKLPGILKRMNKALKRNGTIFASFMYGNGTNHRDGRVYCDFTKDSIEPVFSNAGFSLVSIWGGESSQSDKYIGSWIIVIAVKQDDKHKSTHSLTIDQERALKVMGSNRNVFLSGAAGTGKSFLIHEFIKENKDKNIIVCAPTGLAAVNVGGATLNRVFYIPTAGIIKVGQFTENTSRAVRQADIIIIDEISMCRIDVFEYIIRTLNNVKKQKEIAKESDHLIKRIILVGDFYQLPPVLTRDDEKDFEAEWGLKRGEDRFAYNSSLWDELSLVNIILKVPVRQNNDLEYMENLNKIRIGDSSAIEWFNTHVQRTPIQDAVYICGKNNEAREINIAEGEKINGDYSIFKAVSEGKVSMKEFPADEELKLKLGMKVITVVNSEDEYQNGSLGYVTRIENSYVGIKFLNGRTANVTRYTWEFFDYIVEEDKVERVHIGSIKQFPLKVAYAITIHKSQGQTFSAVNVSPKCFDRGQLYVALSRVKKIKDMSISCDIIKDYLRTSKAVYDFYDDLDDELLGWEFDEHKWDSADENDTAGKYSFRDRIQRVIATSYQDWTNEEDELLKEELEKGLNVADISRSHQRTIGAIRSRIISLFGVDV